MNGWMEGGKEEVKEDSQLLGVPARFVSGKARAPQSLPFLRRT